MNWSISYLGKLKNVWVLFLQNLHSNPIWSRLWSVLQKHWHHTKLELRQMCRLQRKNFDQIIWNGACLTFPTKNPPPSRFTHDHTTFIEELQKAVEAIQALQQELEMSKLVNSYDEFFFTEKIKDLEFELSELSDNFSDIRSYWISLKKGQILHHWISNSEIFINWGHCHLSSNWWTRNFEMNTHSQRWVKFQSGYKTCEIALLENTNVG